MKATTVLGIDFGERRIGVAVSDVGKTLAVGVGTIDRRSHDALLYLDEVIREENVESIVIGYPLRTDGKEVAGGKTDAVDAFIRILETRFGLPVHREDESYTSQLAEESLRGRRKKNGKQAKRSRKEEIDRVAACYILQDYLNRTPAP